MTEQMAINRLLTGNTAHSCKADYIKLAINALEKQVPKKLIVKKECFARAKDGRQDFVFMYFCPNCNTKVRVDFKHCYECGQKLDSEV